jgi:hypothetical protein
MEHEPHKLTILEDLRKSIIRLKQTNTASSRYNHVLNKSSSPDLNTPSSDCNSSIKSRIISSIRFHESTCRDAIAAALQTEEERDSFLQRFWARDDRRFDSIMISDYSSPKSSLDPKLDSIRTISASEFKKEFLNTNKPCIIKNIPMPITSEWYNETSGIINTKWFLDHIGACTNVPVRINQEGFVNGRATECITEQTSMQEWISHKRFDPKYYLKDWHMQSLFPKKLYDTPIIFPDVLNPFLMDVDGGEYMFVYWGCKGSSTSLHSDVLNSFSWSFNVIGKKLWTFYPMEDYSKDETDDLSEDETNVKTAKIIQETGDMIYVPSGWRHEVINLEETISVNHNWISAGSLDCVWECLVNEIGAIEEELIGWGLDSGSNLSFQMNHMRENMLRGCVGMDVSTLCVLLIRIFIDRLAIVTDENIQEKDTIWNAWFEFSRVMLIVDTILYDDSKSIDDTDVSAGLHIFLKGRLRSTLGEDDANELLSILVMIRDICREVLSLAQK